MTAPHLYEKALAPMISYNERKPLTDVPPDLQCSPYRDDPDHNDHRVLKELLALGVTDATKVSKKSVGYERAKGSDQCHVCANWQGPQAELAICGKVGGAIRFDRWCKLWETGNGQAQQATPRLQGGGGQDRPAGGDPGSGSGAGLGNPQGLAGGQESQPAPQPGKVIS